MKSEVIAVSSKGRGMDAALAQADSTAQQMALSHRDAVHMHLLVEEMMSMVRSIIGQLEGRFWIETEDKGYRLVLQMKSLMDSEQRAQLLSASTSGKNEAHRGIMGKDESAGAQEEWDELEKSLVTRIADNVTVSIHGYEVELAIIKKLG